jgi:MobA/MobL family
VSEGHCHIKFGVIQRSCGDTAVARLGYQTCSVFVDAFETRGDYSADRKWHRGTAVLLPPGSLAEFAKPAIFCDALTKSERRRDAQEGRTMDFSLPRGVPAGAELLVSAWVLAPLVESGMALQVDCERPPASDGADNAHAHVTLAQRVISMNGFGKKCRGWNKQFRDNDGKAMRSFIASRITAACAQLGIPEYVDPRRSAEPDWVEERFSQKLWRKSARGENSRLDDLFISREFVKQFDDRKVHEPLGEDMNAQISCAGRKNLRFKERRIRVAEIGRVAAEASMTVNQFEDDHRCWAILTQQGRGMIEFDGEVLSLLQCISTKGDSERLFQFVKALGWSSIIVDGDQDIVDEMVLLGAAVGVVPINRSACATALTRISDPDGVQLLRALAPFDLLDSVGAAIAAYRRKADDNVSAGIVEVSERLKNEVQSGSHPAAVASFEDFPEFPIYRPAIRSQTWLDVQAAEQARLVERVDRDRREMQEFLAPYVSGRHSSLTRKSNGGTKRRRANGADGALAASRIGQKRPVPDDTLLIDPRSCRTLSDRGRYPVPGQS